MPEAWPFYFLAFIILSGALGVLLLRNVMHSAYSLMLCLSGIAVLYIYAGAEFLGVTQLLIYVGGIVVLLIFGIMFSRVKNEKQHFSRTLSAFFLTVGIAILLVTLIYRINWPIQEKFNSSPGHVKELGFAFFTDHLLAFEVAGVLLLVAIIGSMAVAGNKKA